jgi:hypothetical protein
MAALATTIEVSTESGRAAVIEPENEYRRFVGGLGRKQITVLLQQTCCRHKVLKL